MTQHIQGQELPDVDAPPQVDLRRYHQAGFQRGRPGWIVLLWWFLQAVIFPITPHAFHAPRIALLRLFGAKIGRGVVIRPSARVTFPWKLVIGNYSWIGDDVVLYNLDNIRIGDHCVISQRSYLCTGSHDIADPCFQLQTGEIVIGNGVWIATDCFVAPNVHIGANTVVGARSSVFGHLPAGQVCWGTPCHPRYPRHIL
ncbi:MAG: hormogonium polysaccharide biosynthesis acetyltransferase HpsU [Cyanobacteriota bacterium SKYGB_h_bin112]|nr:hormogonium polysaccharide biosynthesis acetyltransferase HpsU [Cyanobacteriota bacterium SKYGB_h_bin112]